MSEAGVSAGNADAEARRLEELEKVTREYAEDSSQSLGLAGLLAAALLLGSVAVALWAGRR